MEQLHTMLMPAPVELPCRAEYADGPLCDRDAAMLDVAKRFGMEGASTANALYLLCGGEPEAGEVQTCTRRVNEPMTIHAAGGHMHLLGREIRIETNPGTPRAETVLDIPVWNFDDQKSRPVKPVKVKPGDTLTVTCRHDQSLRDKLPAFEGQALQHRRRVRVQVGRSRAQSDGINRGRTAPGFAPTSRFQIGNGSPCVQPSTRLEPIQPEIGGCDRTGGTQQAHDLRGCACGRQFPASLVEQAHLLTLEQRTHAPHQHAVLCDQGHRRFALLQMR
jgi:hypothetical protein